MRPFARRPRQTSAPSSPRTSSLSRSARTCARPASCSARSTRRSATSTTAPTDGRLAQRLCGLIFLIRKLPLEAVADIGVRATPEMLADLMVSDLANDGTELRKNIPRILKLLADPPPESERPSWLRKAMQDKGALLIEIEGEYSLQTRESSEWDREFRNRQTRLNSDLTSLSSKRGSLISAACGDALKGIKLAQGKCKEPRKLLVHFGSEAPPAGGTDIPVWVRDGWGEKESTVVNDARAAGSDSPIIYVYVPKASADDLQKAIVEYEAAKSTLDFKGTPTTPEGREARDAMATRMATAEAVPQPDRQRRDRPREGLPGRRRRAVRIEPRGQGRGGRAGVARPAVPQLQGRRRQPLGQRHQPRQEWRRSGPVRGGLDRRARKAPGLRGRALRGRLGQARQGSPRRLRGQPLRLASRRRGRRAHHAAHHRPPPRHPQGHDALAGPA